MFERVIDNDFELTEKVCSIFMRQICEGVDYMHSKLIMHLDMKPENILCVTRTGNRIKLIDFGLARRFDPSKTLQVMFGTPDFAAPEVLSYERVTPAADMWSVGVICYVLLSGLSPFMGNSDLETMTNVTRAIYDFDDESFEPISSEAKEFISKLLLKDPRRRLKPTECLDHQWLAKTPVKRGKMAQLSKTKLKKYVVRRRWQKAVTAIMALRRMGANLSLTGSLRPSSAAVTTKNSSSSSSSRFSSSISSSSVMSSSRTKQPTQAKVTTSSRFSSTSSTSTIPPSSTSTPTTATGSRFSSSPLSSSSTSTSPASTASVGSTYRAHISSTRSSTFNRRY